MNKCQSVLTMSSSSLMDYVISREIMMHYFWHFWTMELLNLVSLVMLLDAAFPPLVIISKI